MKKFKILLLILSSFLFIACSDDAKKEGMHKVHWDRDMCERCKMIVSERHFAVQVVDIHNKPHMFDDLGCAVLWFKEENIEGMDQAKFWINDAVSGEWIDARTAQYAVGKLTPMGYGVSAYTKKTFPEGSTKITFEDAQKIIYDIDKEQKRKRALKKAQRQANEHQ